MGQNLDMVKNKHIVLTSHPPHRNLRPHPINWGEKTPEERGPVIGSLNSSQDRNVMLSALIQEGMAFIAR